MTTLDVDRPAIEAFVGALYRYADEGTHVQFRGFVDSRNGGPWGIWPTVKLNGSGLGELVDAAVTFAQQCANAPEPVVFAPPVVTLNNATKAAEANIANGIVLSVECDEAPSAARAWLEGLLGPATTVIESGGVWTCPITGKTEAKLHLHWRLQEPTREQADHNRLKEARSLAQQLAGADGSAVPLVHPMRWPGSWHRKNAADPKLARIVELNEAAEIDLGEALELLREAFAARGEAEPGSADPGSADYANHKSSKPEANFFDIAAALEAIPNDDLRWDEWNNRVGLASWAASSGSEAGFHAFNAWSAKSSKYDPSTTRERWDHISKHPPDRIGFGTLAHLAKEARPGWRKPSDYVAPGSRSVTATPFVLTDPVTLPRREFLYGRHLIRRYISTTVAPGASGKSSLIVAEALSMVSARALLGEAIPASPLRVWHINLEDPEDELKRRIAAAAIHFGIRHDDIEDRLFLDSGRRVDIVIAKDARDGIELAVPVIEALKAEIIEKRIDVLQIDPFVSCHAVEENSNTKIAAVVRQWAMIAEETNCAIELVHHVRKPSGGREQKFTVDDARGAVALIAAVRSARVLNVMSQKQAEAANISNPFAYFYIGNGKANLAPRDNKAKWCHLVSVPLGNGTSLLDPGDTVAAVEPWKWPGPFAEVGLEDAKEVQRRIAGGEWRQNSRSTEWAGIVVAQVLGLDISDKDVKAQIRTLLADWVATGALKVVQHKGGNRNKRKFIEVGQWLA